LKTHISKTRLILTPWTEIAKQYQLVEALTAQTKTNGRLAGFLGAF
jgi:hypothetical protein